MPSDEPVEDPYLTLGVAKDADISAIRSAHRKLLLKYHPDRLKGEEHQAKGKDAFQKIQQAYVLLSDPTTRARHDNQVKLAQLKKEAMNRDLLSRTAAFPMRPPPPWTPNREYRDRIIYEQRAPSASYFDEGYRYREEEPRTTSRKYDGYERERRPEFGQPEKERKSGKRPEKTNSDLPFDIALKFKVKAQKTRDAAKEKTREKEMHASSAKSKDRDHRSPQMDKQRSRRAYVENDDSSDSDIATYVTINRPSPRPSKSPYDSTPRPRSEVPAKVQKGRETVKEKIREKEIHASSAKSRDRSARVDKYSSKRAYDDYDYFSSDSDTATYVATNRPSPRPSKSPYDSTPRPRSKPEPSRRRTSTLEEDEDEDKWRGIHIDAKEYIERSQRPSLSGRTSSSQTYRETPDDRQTGRQSGSDGEARPRSSKGRRPSVDVQETRPPLLSSRHSAPELKVQFGRDGSRLKYAETHDSGSSWSGTSSPTHGTTRYRVIDSVPTHRRTRSPSPLRVRDRPQRPTMPTDSRPRSSRGTSYQHLERLGSYDYMGLGSRGKSL
jgi:curved DNA-binding protein CbpA